MTFRESITILADRESNPIKGIPINLPSFKKVYPYFEKGDRILLTADSGAGKSYFITQLFILDVIDYVQANPGLETHIYYFSVELASLVYHCRVFNHLLGKKGIIYPIFELLNPTKKIIEDLKLIEKELAFIESKVTIIDNITSPTTITNYMVKEMNKYGKLNEAKNKFTYNNHNQYVFLIVDTINAMDNANSKEHPYQDIKKWSEYYAKQGFSKIYKCIVVNCQQQDNSVRANQFSNMGSKVDEKHEPSTGTLSHVKTTATDHTLVLSLFKPSSYKISSYMGYNINQLGDHYVKLNVMKNTFGVMGPNVNTHLFWRGDYGFFEEMPDSKSPELESFLQKRGINKFKLKSNFNPDLV